MYMYCPFIVNQYGNPQECEKKYCALWIKDSECCSLKAIATGVLSQAIIPTVQSGRVSISDITPNYTTTTNVDSIESNEYEGYDYIFSFPGGDQ